LKQTGLEKYLNKCAHKTRETKTFSRNLEKDVTGIKFLAIGNTVPSYKLVKSYYSPRLTVTKSPKMK